MTASAEPVATTALVPAAAAAPPRVLSEDSGSGSIAAFSSERHFAAARGMAKYLCSSTMVPSQYQGENNLGNCLVAMEMAGRVGASVLAVMQNVHVIQGRPSWSSAFLIGSVNACGRFSALRYEVAGGDDASAESYRVRAYATEKATGERLNGTWITWKMVHGEGWSKKNGSKWLTMPEQMFQYRSAAFWTRAFAPEISLGMHSADEVEDMSVKELRAIATVVPSTGADKLRALVATPALQSGGVVINDAEVVTVENTTEAQPSGNTILGPETDALVKETLEAMVDEVAPGARESVAAEVAAAPADTTPADIKALRMRREAGKRLTPNEQEKLSTYEAISK